MSALKSFEATEANLEKLERLWDEIQGLLPDGLTFGSNAAHEERVRHFDAVLSALPLIDGWKPSIALPSSNDVAQMRLDAQEVGDADAYIWLHNELEKPGIYIRDYRFRFNQKRRDLVRAAVYEHFERIDADLRDIRSKLAAAGEIDASMWAQLRQRVRELNVLLGSSVERPQRWRELIRHLSFGQVSDLDDIERLDWPEVKAALLSGLYGENEPIPVGVEDLGAVVRAKPGGQVSTKLKWDALDAEAFERLIFTLVSQSDGYENAALLTHTNAPDRGRDISAYRVIQDTLAGSMRLRVIVQCKHWLKKSIGVDEIGVIKEQMNLWDSPPVDVVVIASSGRFTADAVAAVEKHNLGDHRLKIEMWADSQLEQLLAEVPALIAQFGLR